ncbi:pirin family protein [Quadrisphaera sp. DSM 44207]|uniref:pirin family protein n=1 Tax=Quadrisphaera sp. DSM 44207 TaxID=1881057 RepID=UPI00087F7C39|nr:pirin family protein [Quadrisphaera sp. DSM 44207]SDQ36188.1 hypothetical protein SAMN05428996_1403 [Quadrisphaera sp. DSM 44207]
MSAPTSGPVLELLPGREVPLGGVRGTSVTRWLPQRTLPTVGAWCFLDRIGPQRVDMRVLPHPHTGLQTVTWPLAGEVHHRDSLGTDVLLRPGELNLMTSGRGICHSELSVGHRPLLHALQLWVALPASRAAGAPGFEQHRDLPVLEAPGARATVVVGALGDVASPASVHTPLLGADVAVDAGASAVLPLRPDFEHAVLVLDGAAQVAGADLAGGPLLHLGTGRDELVVRSPGGARLLLLGGEPFGEDLVMWWNFVGRDHDEVARARAEWEEAGQTRFGTVPGHGDERIPAPGLPSVRLTPRRRRPAPAGADVGAGADGGAPAPAMS